MTLSKKYKKPPSPPICVLVDIIIMQCLTREEDMEPLGVAELIVAVGRLVRAVEELVAALEADVYESCPEDES